jgi:hypothetical protein
MISCLRYRYSHFISRLQRNLVTIIVTTFALMSLERAGIRAAKQGFQTQWHVDEVTQGAIVISMRKWFELIPASHLDFFFKKMCPKVGQSSLRCRGIQHSMYWILF